MKLLVELMPFLERKCSPSTPGNNSDDRMPKAGAMRAMGIDARLGGKLCGVLVDT